VTTTTTISPCYRPTGVYSSSSHTLAWEAAAAHSEGATRMRTVAGHPSTAASCLSTKKPFVHLVLFLVHPLLCFFFFKLLRPFYIFVQVAQPNQTKGKDQSAQEEPLGRVVSGKWDEIGTKREIVQMTSTGRGELQVTSSSLVPVLLGSLALPVSSPLCWESRLREFLALGSFLLVITSG
jgi:hypothetical protein